MSGFSFALSGKVCGSVGVDLDRRITMRWWTIATLAALFGSSAANAETYTTPQCLKKTASNGQSVTFWVTLSGDAASRLPVLSAHLYGTEQDPIGGASLGILIDEKAIVTSSLETNQDSYVGTIRATASPKLNADQEYKLTARSYLGGITVPTSVSMTIDIDGGCGLALR